MAITASVAMSSATCKSGQQVIATLTVSNSGGSAVVVTGIEPVVTPNGQTSQAVAVGVGRPAVGGNFSSSVAASGSTAFPFPVCPNAPTTSAGLAMPSSLVYSIGATVLTSDGAITAATPATVTVTNNAGL
jgi:hypothetical protein